MGLFGIKSNDTVKGSGVVSWLKTADKAYNYALSTHTLQGLSKYFEGNASTYIIDYVSSNKREHQGLDRYRHVEFKLDKSDGRVATYLKIVTYDNVKLQYGISVPVGDAYTEQWTVTKVSGVLKVCAIKRVFV